jgi:hypothetical protein
VVALGHEYYTIRSIDEGLEAIRCKVTTSR